MSAIEFADVCKTYGQSGSATGLPRFVISSFRSRQGRFVLCWAKRCRKNYRDQNSSWTLSARLRSVGIFAGDAVYSSGAVGFAPEEADLPEFLSVDELLQQTACGLSGITLAPARLDRAVKMLELLKIDIAGSASFRREPVSAVSLALLLFMNRGWLFSMSRPAVSIQSDGSWSGM